MNTNTTSRSALAAALSLFAGVAGASAQVFTPNDLVVTRLQYQLVGEVAVLQVGSPLPYTGNPSATHDGTFPGVFDNVTPDPNFGVLAPIYLDSVNPLTGTRDTTFAVPTSLITSSFSSKSEGSLSLSTDGTQMVFAGYAAPAGAIDRSNSTTPGVGSFSGQTDSAAATYRAAAQVDSVGNVRVTTTNAYAGDNPRAAVQGSNGLIYMTGNTGSSDATVTGSQIITPGVNATSASKGTVPAGAFVASDNKPAKDNNFRGETIYNNTLYVTKGSGSSGVNSVYQVGNAGTLPTGSGNTISILPGLPTSGTTGMHPFGLWFANATTLYIADDGGGATGSSFAGVEKWTFNGSTWGLVYTLQTNLVNGVDSTYNVAGDSNTITTVGTRSIIGRVNGDGTVTLYATTATTSAATEVGADPNRLVSVTDLLANPSSAVANGEAFTTLQTAQYGDVLRGVTFTAVPEPSTVALLTTGVAFMVWGSGKRLVNKRLRKRVSVLD